MRIFLTVLVIMGLQTKAFSDPVQSIPYQRISEVKISSIYFDHTRNQ